MSSLRTPSKNVLFGAAMILAGALIAPAFVHAQPNPPGLGPLDHYKVYTINSPTFTGFVLLEDQFGGSVVHFAGPFFLGTPAQKNDEPVHDTTVHLSWYKIFTPEPVRTVIYANQFREDQLRVGSGEWMLVPTLKNQPAHSDPFPTLPVDHFKCYHAEGAPIGITVTLQTQFGQEIVQVMEPQWFCNPAQKLNLDDGHADPIQNETDHLVCYRILPPQTVGTSVVLQDQFWFHDAIVLESQWLCVPSLKTGVTATENTTWSRVRATYR
jgi:hypothetical protein